MKPYFYKTSPSHNIAAQSITLESFMDMTVGDLMVTPSGNFCVMGDNQLIEEIVDMGEYEDTGNKVREFEFEDMGGTKRRIFFIDGYAAEYAIITVNNRIPNDTTGISDAPIADDPVFEEFVQYDLGYLLDPLDFMEE